VSYRPFRARTVGDGPDGATTVVVYTEELQLQLLAFDIGVSLAVDRAQVADLTSTDIK